MRYLLTILIFAGTLYGQQLSADDVLNNVRTRYQSVSDASASFSQTVKLRFRKSGRTFNGTVQIKKGNKYRIESEQQTIVTNGVTVWMYTPSTKQVLIDTYSPNRHPFSPDKFLTGLPEDFTAVSAAVSDSLYQLVLQPTKKNSALSNINSITVRTRSGLWTVESIDIAEKSGTVTSITLSGLRLNKGIDDSVFRFTVTGEMHIVDMKTLK
jgi:chaperone LolA